MPYTIYVIELSKKAYSESTKFRNANPQYNGRLECVYVGMTSKTPQERFLQHRQGAKSKRGHNIASSLVKKYGTYLRSSLYGHLPRYQSREEALKMEQQLTVELRRKGFAVWSN